MRQLQAIIRWFKIDGTVSRKEYALVGVGLMLLKYVVEACVIGYTACLFYTPFDFINPLLSARSQFTVGAPTWLGLAWVLWTLPFLWIAVAMSIRRAVDVGASPWAGLLVLVPIINLVAMVYLAAIPKGCEKRQHQGKTREKMPVVDLSDEEHARNVQGVNSILVGVGIGFAYMFAILVCSVDLFESYGASLFFGTPLIAAAATAYVYNRWCPRSLGSTIGLSVLTCCCFAGGLLLFGLEGMVCIAMAAPIAFPIGILGALVGHGIARQQRVAFEKKDKGLLSCLLVVPFLVGIEPYVAPQSEFEVVSAVEIKASPEQVWQCVIEFPELEETPEWFFRWGISCPQAARIVGTGVGAIRYCEFTTGEFVEPITIWDAPRQLAFDVAEQPHPMFEMTPYRHIHPPHLDGAFRSTRGEFRLIPLSDGGTRLEGSTWYQLDIYPHAYWTLWSDELVHRIHGRVLRHIKRLAESAPTSAG